MKINKKPKNLNNLQKNRKKNQNNFQQKPQNAKSANQRGLWLCGKHPVFLALQKKRREIFEILVTKNSFIELEKFLTQKNLTNYKSKIKLVEADYIQSIIGEHQTHQGIALNCSALPLKSQNDLLQDIEKASAQEKLPTLLILDQLQDPHNVGAIIRTACAFGVIKIILPEHNSARETAVLNKASSGMIDNVDLFLVTNLNNLLTKLKELNYWCIGLAGEGEASIGKIKEYPNVALIVGSEGNGIRELVKKNCDLLVKIPMSSDVESLNASVAASIALWELAQKNLS